MTEQNNSQLKPPSSERHHEITNLTIKEVNGYWFLVNSEKLVPYAQISHLCDIQNCSMSEIIKSFETGHYIERRWRSIEYYLRSQYKSEEELALSLQWLQQFSSQSQVTSYFTQVFRNIYSTNNNNNSNSNSSRNNQQKQGSSQENDDMENMAPVALALQSIDLFAHEDVQGVYTLALKLIRATGIHAPTDYLGGGGDNVAFMPKITGFGLLCALIDCYPKEREQIFMQAKQELYFQGILLQKLLQSYASQQQHQNELENSVLYQQQQQQLNKENDFQQNSMSQLLNYQQNQINQGKAERTYIVKEMLDKFSEMQQKKVRQASFLTTEFQELYDFMTTGESQSALVMQQQQQQYFQSNSDQQDIPSLWHLWRSIKMRILNRSSLSKREIESWRQIAFSELYRDALLMLGEKSLILDNDVNAALACYAVLFATGEAAGAGILYSLLTLSNDNQINYQAALIVAQRVASYLKKANCYVKLGRQKDALDLIKAKYFTDKDFASEVFAPYTLIKCVFLTEEKRFFGALAIFDILRRDRQQQQENSKNSQYLLEQSGASPLLKLFLLAKLLEKSNYIQFDQQKMMAILKYAKYNFTPRLMYEYITLIFIKKKISQLKKLSQFPNNSQQQQQANSNIYNFIVKKKKKKKKQSQGVGADNIVSSGNKKNSSSSMKQRNYAVSQEQQQQQKKDNHQQQQKSGYSSSQSSQKVFKQQKQKQQNSDRNRYSVFHQEQDKYDQQVQEGEDRDNQQNEDTLKWQSQIETIIGTNIAEVRHFIEEELEILQKQLENNDNQLRTKKMMEHTQFLYNLGISIIFPKIQYYNLKNISFFQIDVKKQNKAISQSYARFKNQVSTWFFHLISVNNNNISTQLQVQDTERVAEKSDQQLYQKNETNQIKQNEKIAYLNNIVFQLNSNQNNNPFPDVFNFTINQQTQALEFSGRLIKEYPRTFEPQDIVLTNFNKNNPYNQGHFAFNNQKCSVFSITLDNLNEDQIFFNLCKSVSPFALNLYGYLTQEILPQQQKQQQDSNKPAQQIQQQDKQDSASQTIKTYYILTEPVNLSFYDLKTSMAQTVSELSIMIQLLTVCASLHLAGQGGILSLYGQNLIYWDYEFHVKTLNPLSILFGTIKLDEGSHAPEMYLDDSQRNTEDASKSDIWALGALLYKIFYGLPLISNQSSQDSSNSNNNNNSSSNNQLLTDFMAFRQKAKVTEILEKQPDENLSIFPISKCKEHIKNYLKNFISMCLIYDPYSRPSAAELLLYMHDYLKTKIKSTNNLGIFTFFSYNSLIKRINSLHRVVFNNQENQQQQQQNTGNTDVKGNNIENANNNEDYQDLKLADQQQQNQQRDNNKDKQQKDNKQINKSSFSTEHKQKQNLGQQQNNEVVGQKSIRPQSSIYSRNSQASVQFTEPADKQQATQGANNQQKNQTQIYILSNGSILVYLGQGFLFFFGSDRQQYVLYNPYLESKETVNTFTLPEILQGEGYLTLEDGRQFLGQFGENGILQSCELNFNCNNIQQKSEGKINYSQQFIYQFDEQTRLPLESTISRFCMDKNSKEAQGEDEKSLNQFCNNVKILFSNNLFPDIFGNWLHCDFNDNTQPSIGANRDPVLLIDNNKTLLIKNSRIAQMLDLATLSFLTWGNSSQQYNLTNYGNPQQQKGQPPNDQTGSNSNNNDQSREITITACIEQLQSTNHLRQLLLEGIKYQGEMEEWIQQQGVLQFQFGDRMLIQHAALPGEPYLTRIDYLNGDFYEGIISNGQYNGHGVYGNGQNTILDGLFKDDKFIHGIIYYYDDILDYYEGDVIYSPPEQQNQQSKQQTYLRHGKGTLYFCNKDVYEGQFQFGLYEGYGLLKYKGGRKGIFEGNFHEGQRDGQGILKDEQGNIYQGLFYKGKKHYQGKETYKNGNQYEGEYNFGKREGLGILYFAEGNSDVSNYQGLFSDDQRNGEGIEICRDGKKYRVKCYKDQVIRRQHIGFDKNILQQKKIINNNKSNDKNMEDFQEFDQQEQIVENDEILYEEYQQNKDKNKKDNNQQNKQTNFKEYSFF